MAPRQMVDHATTGPMGYQQPVAHQDSQQLGQVGRMVCRNLLQPVMADLALHLRRDQGQPGRLRQGTEPAAKTRLQLRNGLGR